MKKINYFKFALDLCMAVVFVLLFNKQVLGGLTFHEVAGVAFGVAFITHILLNVRWVVNITKRIFDRKLPGATRFGYILNVLLLITMTAIVVSGILVSKILFPNARLGDQHWFTLLHVGLSILTLIIVGIHLGLHWRWVLTVWNKIVPGLQSKKWAGVTAKLLTVLILVFGGYEIYTAKFIQKTAASSTFIVTGDTAQGSAIMGGGGRPQGSAGGQQGGGAAAGQQQGGAPSGKPSGSGTQGGQQQSGGAPAAGMQRPPMASVNPFTVLSTYFGIMSVFVIITYYLEKLATRRRRSPELGV